MFGHVPLHGLRSNLDAPATPTPQPSSNPSNPPGPGRAGGRQHYPAALRSELSKRYNGPVTGVAIIDHDYPAIDVLVQMVTPDATPLTEPLTAEYLQDCVEEMDQRCHSAILRGEPPEDEDDDDDDDSLAGSVEGTEHPDPSVYEAAMERRRQEREQRRGSFFASRGSASVPTSTGDLTAQGNGSFTGRRLGRLGRLRSHRGSHVTLFGLGVPGSHSTLPSSNSLPEMTEKEKPQQSKNPRRRKLLKEGGYIIFADEYVMNHPCSPVSSITQEFHLVNPADAPPPPDPKLDEKKRKVEEIKRLIKEAELQQRPLFRRRPAELVYGEARYIPRPTRDAVNETDSQGRDDDAEVYLASSFASSASGQPNAGADMGSRHKRQHQLFSKQEPTDSIRGSLNVSPSAEHRHHSVSSSNSGAGIRAD